MFPETRVLGSLGRASPEKLQDTANLQLLIRQAIYTVSSCFVVLIFVASFSAVFLKVEVSN